ncbi:MAG: MATE family efflux transporter [SAR86 cluster bacterium]|uniref:Multidrug-efflux transporter n=1 Tax=SAR86 cluster bacterium TaxID=2030880 RepID=A0A2A5ASF1_9GAMM|nr:MAG: MATE family efflux transporter [SAR86 cluster bacterium]
MTVQKIKNGWALFKESLSGGTEINYTEGSIARMTLLLAIPMILEMAMESVFAVVDIFFVSGLGTDAVATVGLTEAMISLLYAVAVGLSMGTTALIARRIGEKNPEAASLAAGQAIWLGLFVSVVVGLLGIFYAKNILLLMGADEAVVETGETYTRLMFGGSFTIVFLFLVNAIFRGAGDASLAMRALTLANCINIVLDPCLIYGYGPFPELGITGAAVATNIGRGVGVLYGLYYLCGGGGRIRLHFANLVLQLGVVTSLFRISMGGVAQFLVATASWVFLMQIVSGFGSEAVAGYTVGVRVVMFSILPAWGLSNAAATLVGQNLGAGLPDRAETSVWLIVKFNAIYMGCVALLIVLFTRQIVGIFTSEPAVAEYAVQCLRIFAAGFVAWGAGMAIIQAFNGAGDTMTPTWINIFCFWLVQVPLAYTLALVLDLGPVGVFWSVFVSDILTGIIGYLVFRRGKWKLRTV